MPLLTCPRCGSAVDAPETTTAPERCPVCGAALRLAPEPGSLPIREAIFREASHPSAWEADERATHAVARDELEPITAQVHTDHQYQQRPVAMPHREDEPTQVATTSVLPASGMGPQPDTTQALPASALPEKRQKRSGLRTLSIALAALLLVAIVVAAALAGNGLIGGAHSTVATGVTTPTATATPPPSFTLPGRYQLTTPSGWLAQQRNAPPQTYYALLSAPTGGVSVNIEAQQMPRPLSLAALDQQFISVLAQPGSTPSHVSAPTTVVVGGQGWTQLTADVTLVSASGQPTAYAHVAALSTQRGAYAYTIVCVATSPSAAAAGPAFTTANQAYFQPLLASFRFLS